MGADIYDLCSTGYSMFTKLFIIDSIHIVVSVVSLESNYFTHLQIYSIEVGYNDSLSYFKNKYS